VHDGRVVWTRTVLDSVFDALVVRERNVRRIIDSHTVWNEASATDLDLDLLDVLHRVGSVLIPLGELSRTRTRRNTGEVGSPYARLEVGLDELDFPQDHELLHDDGDSLFLRGEGPRGVRALFVVDVLVQGIAPCEVIAEVRVELGSRRLLRKTT